MKRLDLSGKTFGRLAVLSYAGSNPHGRSRWLCQCVCGEQVTVTSQHLTDGTTTSCGCAARDAARARALTHGCSGTPEYRSWVAMVHRCTDPKRADFKHYGGRGIAIDPQWLRFERFLADMGERPTPQHTLEREDNDGPYAPGNCYWATKREQSNNTRRNVHVTFRGRTQTLAQWARELQVPYSTLQWRRLQGWSDSQVITGA